MTHQPLSRLPIVFAGFLAFAMPVHAQNVPAPEVGETEIELSILEQWDASRTTVFDSIDIELEEFRFLARPLVVFADSAADPLFIEQMDLLNARSDDLRLRDVILITDTDPAARSPIRQELRPRGFALVLIGKDGRVAQRKPAPWSVRELSRAIDKMPLRQQEIRDSTQTDDAG